MFQCTSACSSSSRPPSVEVDHGNCALSLSVRSALLQAIPPVAYEANAGMAVLVAEAQMWIDVAESVAIFSFRLALFRWLR